MFRGITETHGELSILGAVAATGAITALVHPLRLAVVLVIGIALASMTVYLIGSANKNRNKKLRQQQQQGGGRRDSHGDASHPRCPRCGFDLQPDRCARTAALKPR